MEKLKFGDVVRIVVDREIFTGYDKGTLAAVVDRYNMGDKMRYRVVDSECKYIVEDGWWYDEDELEFTGRNVSYKRNTKTKARKHNE
jgi:hypothetical protein